jgi:hypothetical protein
VVKFGTASATNVTVVNDTTVTATAPAGTAGTVDITVTTPGGGTSATGAADHYTYIAPPPAPAVTGVNPTSGPTAGGTTVTITGSALTGTSVVKFGTASATNVTVVNDTTVTATSPPGAGTVDITVTTPGGGTSATGAADHYTYIAPPPAPAVTGVNPTSGPTAGGTTVTITGTNFTGATAVNFGQNNPASFTATSDTSITATSPAGTGTVDITVTVPGAGTSTTNTNDHYTYTAPPPAPAVTGVSPTSGPTAGGTTVTITGTNLTGATAVNFGTASATNVTVVNDTTVTATSPAGTGTVDITVTVPGAGTSTTNTNDHYTYTAPPPAPAVTSVSPTSGPTAGGTTVTITGTNLTGATAVNFGTASATNVTVVSDTTVTATSPAGTGAVDITVTVPGAGTSTTNANDQYTYTATPPGSIPPPTAGGWQLNGSAQLVTTASPPNLQLTPATNWVTGSAFWPQPVPGVGVSASFDAFIGPGSGADGMTFTLADASATQATALGVGGGGEGFSGINGIAVSLDTWQNTTDPSSNFVGIAITNSPTQSLNYVTTDTSIPSLINTVHTFVVTTTSTGITVTMDGAQVLNYPTALPPYVLLGFTGATGGFNDVHQVQNVAITAGPPLLVPLVSAVNPSSGPTTGGTQVTITGANFSTVSAVNFGATPATGFSVQSATSITATAPASAAGVGPIDVTVTTGQGTSATSTNDQFTYQLPPPPTVTGVSPTSGPSTGGTSVTVTGTNFTGVSAVSFGASPVALFTVNSPTSITAIAPPGSGTVDVTVTATVGTSAVNASDQFIYVVVPPPPPTVTGVDPVSGPVGSLVTVLGTNFVNVNAVNFGATPATSFTVNTASTVTAIVPAGTGTVDVTVTTATGTSTVNTSDQFTYTAGSPPGSVPSPVAGGWQLNGTALLGTTASPPNLQLTQTTNWQAGSAFWPTPVPGVGVTASFDAFIGPTSGADGMTFTLADASVTQPTALGTNGGGEGFAGIHGLAVSLDTWQNGADPSGNFVGIATATARQQSLAYATTNSSIPPLINIVHHFVVTTLPTGITVSMDGTQVLSYTTALPPYVLLGFTGATGGFNDIHQIQNVAITAGPPPPVPTVTGVTPSSGPTTGGTTVAITGTGLTSTSAVNFGGTPATTFVVENDSTVTATAPAAKKLGPVDVTVTTAGGTTTTSTADQFNYTSPPVPTVTGVSPSSGPSTGGNTVTVTGTGLTGASAVNFGAGDPAVFFTVNSPTSMTVTAPPGALGIVDVTVTTPGGSSSAAAGDHYTYVVPPTPAVTGVSPSSGPNGTAVTITGSNFTGASSVMFGTASATYTVQDAATITATAPAGAGPVDVTVTTPGGTSPINANDKYTYTVPSAPTVTALNPSSGFATTSVVVVGTNFTGASAVSFGGTPAAGFTVNSDTSITAIAPAGTGPVDVTVTTTGGSSATTTADQFTYLTGAQPVTQVATYRGDLGRSGYYPNESGLSQSNVSTLKLHWTDTGGTGSFAQPIVANNLVYWGDWNGNEHATDLTGHDVWSVNVGVTTDASCSPSVAGVSGTVTAGLMGNTPVVYVPGGDGNLYALNALTGAQIWKTNLGAPPAVYLWASPILFNGSIYEGVSSFGDCPLVQGQLVQMDASSGSIQHVANMTPNGCIGAGIWTSPTIDPSDGSVYVTTGTPNACATPGEMAPAIVKLRASDLALLSSWTVPTSEQQFGDEDFGGTPTLFTATINGVPRALVGALNKDGLFFAWDRNNVAAGPVWQSTIADPSGSPRSIVSASWDGKYVYVGGGGAIINGTSCYGNISALDPDTGAFVWRSCQTSFMTAALTEVPGLLIEGVGAGGNIKFINTANGATVFTYNTKSTVQGEVTVSNGILYVPLSNGNLVALGQ